MWLPAYRTLNFLSRPLVDMWLRLRRNHGKEDPARYHERLGHASIPRPKGRLVWIHAASVGESLSILPLIERLLARNPALTLLLTTGTVSSAQLMATRLPERAFHQYVPIDRAVCVRRFLAHWKPDAAWFVESELWPNLLLLTHRTCAPMALINARMSERSLARWRKMPSLARQMLACFSLILPQTEADLARFRELGAKRLSYLGNLKTDAPPLPVDAAQSVALQAMIHGRPVWLAASTHPGEEEAIARTHLALKAQHPGLLTILAPRHAERGPELTALFITLGATSVRRSLGETPHADTDLYIADSFGELGLFYHACPFAFIGGSLIPHGGQNPLEAIRLQCAALTGPHTHNFLEIYRDLEQEGGILRVGDEPGLRDAVDRLLREPERIRTLCSTAEHWLSRKGQVMDRMLEALQEVLPQPPASPPP
jgi:3-deoxy-D-manno-octulosonic-acid transferase